MSDSDDYEVGYGKPPVSTRFGQANGNRPNRAGRKSKNLKTDLLDELRSRVALRATAHAKPMTLTKQRALLRVLVGSGLKGNERATAKVFDLLLRLVGPDDGGPQTAELTAEDQEILDNFLKRERDDGNE